MSRKKERIQLMECERVTLQEASKNHPKVEVRQKCQGLLLNHWGMSQREVSKYLAISENTFVNWKKTWTIQGLMGLLRKKGQGRKQILSMINPNHVEYLDKAVEKHSQNVKAIQKELIKELSVSMSTDTVKRFLKRIVTHGDVSVAVPTKDKTNQST